MTKAQADRIVVLESALADAASTHSRLAEQITILRNQNESLATTLRFYISRHLIRK